MKIKFFFILLVFSNVTFGQKTSPFICGHDHVMSINAQNFPDYRNRVDKTFEIAYKNMENAGDRNETFKIPVVVHIVWKNNEENLHDSLIHSQIKVLNDAFRLRNENRTDIREIFKDLQADAEIEFELKDVIRVKTTANFSLSLTDLPDDVKRPANGGSSAIDVERHLNIWVCKIQPIPFIGGQILGYAYPPDGLSNWPDDASAPSKNLEGVVIDYRVFGLNNPNKLTVNGTTHQSSARTTVHEVGHYLGLRHIWGDGGGLFGGNSCNVDDGITDTPNQGTQSAGGCNKNSNTCIDASNDLPDMVENYMDYSGEDCQNTFTKEQVALMRSVLRNQRKLLTNTQQDLEITGVKIWPNPCHTHINIALNDSEPTEVAIRTLDGKLVLNYKIQGTDVISCEGLSNGAYILELGNDKMHKVVKLIKVHD
ncbi:MAG: zinc-dependent metalloprotease [Saprospiraceae bacterium]